MDDLKSLYRHNYLSYASYVILDRAIPNIVDGLKPVQRRILWTLFEMDDGKLHKVANAVGQTMALHPHGDAPIVDALVNLANKNYLLLKQGNFGSTLTSDPAAAARYIETKLSPLAKETLFAPALTKFILSYDGRKKEPVVLPVKIPLLLLHGAEGIAVGMSTKILPHNFNELLEAQISLLQNRPTDVFPDFNSGGLMDCSEYNDGKGPIRLRAKIEVTNSKTLIIREICYGTTTESTIRSIDAAAKKNKFKIEELYDYTTEKVEIEIKLPRGADTKSVLNALYAFTECEVTLHPKMILIKDNMPCEMSVSNILQEHLTLLQGYIKQECLLEKIRYEELIFNKTLERIFIEQKIYKKLESISTYEGMHEMLIKNFKPFASQLHREILKEDHEKLLLIPIRRISRFDIAENQMEIQRLQEKICAVEKKLSSLKRATIHYLKSLLKTYGTAYPRKTEICTLSDIDLKKAKLQPIRVSYDSASGYLGTKVSGDYTLSCQNQDKLLLLFKNGFYQVVPPKDKEFIHVLSSQLSYLGIADKKTPIVIIYYNKASGYTLGKKFVIEKFLQNKSYRFLGEEEDLLYLTTNLKQSIKLSEIKNGRKKGKNKIVSLDDFPLKKVSSKGIKIVKKEINKIELS